MKITYNRNGNETTNEFDSRMDMIEFVILNNIKDEELVSIDLGDGEITGGINGLALETLRQINEAREIEKAMADLMDSFDEDCDCDCDCEDCDCDEDEEEYIPKHASREAWEALN